MCVYGFYCLNSMVLVYKTTSRKDDREKYGFLGIFRGGGGKNLKISEILGN